MDRKAFLASLKPGNPVAIIGREGTRIAKVTKITTTQLTVEGGKRFKRRDGRQIGGSNSFYHDSIEEVTADAVNEANRHRVQSRVWALKHESHNVTVLNYERVDKAIDALIEAFK